MAALEGEDSAYAQGEAVEREQFGSFLAVAREAMEHAAMQPVLIFAEYGSKLVLCLAAVYDEWHAEVGSPFHLFLEGEQLFGLVLA